MNAVHEWRPSAQLVTYDKSRGAVLKGPLPTNCNSVYSDIYICIYALLITDCTGTWRTTITIIIIICMSECIFYATVRRHSSAQLRSALNVLSGNNHLNLVHVACNMGLAQPVTPATSLLFRWLCWWVFGSSPAMGRSLISAAPHLATWAIIIMKNSFSSLLLLFYFYFG